MTIQTQAAIEAEEPTANPWLPRDVGAGKAPALEQPKRCRVQYWEEEEGGIFLRFSGWMPQEGEDGEPLSGLTPRAV